MLKCSTIIYTWFTFKGKRNIPIFLEGNFTLVIALASTPRLVALVLINPATYPADDSIGTVIFSDFPVEVEFTVNV